jgi:RloB-like protein
MKRLRSFWQHGGSLRRDPADNLPSGSSFLIVTEGSKTEPNYFKALRDRLRLVAADVDIEHPEGTDPIVLTQHAITRRDERRAQAARGAAVEYDEVWVVFDLEKTHDQRRRQAQQAVSLGEASGIRFARSDPSFEYASGRASLLDSITKLPLAFARYPRNSSTSSGSTSTSPIESSLFGWNHRVASIRIRPFSQRNADHSSLSISLRRNPAIVARRKILNCSGSSVESSALAFSINLTTSKLERYFMLCRGSKLIPSKGRGLGSLTDSRCLVTSALKRDFARRKMELTEILAERFLVSSLPARLRDGWLTQHFVLGYVRQVPAGLICSNHQ